MCKTFLLSFLITISTLGLVSRAHARPGDLDRTFGTQGRVLLQGYNAESIAIQPDGKLVIAQCDPHQYSVTVARFNPNGSFDMTFGQSGIVTVPAEYGYGCGMTIASNGKIVVTISDESGRVHVTAWLLRFNPDGSLDTTFGGDGIVTPSFPSVSSASFKKVAVQSDGKLVAVGYVRSAAYHSYSATARLNDDGSVDTSFGGGSGLVIHSSYGANNFGSAVAIQADGKIVSAGYSFAPGSRFTIFRIDPNGSPDLTFNSYGAASVEFPNYARANDLVLQPDGKIIIAGETWRDFALARFNTNGTLDSSFDEDGKVTTSFGGHDHRATGVVLQPDGKIIAGGGHSEFDEASWEIWRYGVDLARYNSDGSLDPSFGNNGKISSSLGNGHYAHDIALQADGKLVIAGTYGAGLLLARYQTRSSAPVDFDGDARSDVSVFRPTDSVWYLDRSSQGFSANQFGISTDMIVPADYDGDGKTDIAVYRDGTWWRINSGNNTAEATQFGTSGDIPIPDDHTGDGRDELVIFRNGDWWVLDLSNGQASTINFGLSGDKPVSADYDGDGKADIAIFRPSDGSWWIQRSTAGLFHALFGVETDKAVAGDYTGDGKTDVAVWRPSNGHWYVLRSEDQSYYAVPWGLADDIPAPGDYDGDGRWDISVWRPSNGTWYVSRSAAGTLITPFGASGDRPVPNALVP